MNLDWLRIDAIISTDEVIATQRRRDEKLKPVS